MIATDTQYMGFFNGHPGNTMIPTMISKSVFPFHDFFGGKSEEVPNLKIFDQTFGALSHS